MSFLNDNCMLLIYFQGLGLIANDSTAATGETGAFMNHNPAAFCMDALKLNYFFYSCAFSFLRFLTNPNLIQFKSVRAMLFHPPDYPLLSLRWSSFCGGWLFQEKLKLSSLFWTSFYHVCPFTPAVFDFFRYTTTLQDLPVTTFLVFLVGLCVCITVPGYHGAAGGPGVWALAVIFLISIIATGSFILYKFKRWALVIKRALTCQSAQTDEVGINYLFSTNKKEKVAELASFGGKGHDWLKVERGGFREALSDRMK